MKKDGKRDYGKRAYRRVYGSIQGAGMVTVLDDEGGGLRGETLATSSVFPVRAFLVIGRSGRVVLVEHVYVHANMLVLTETEVTHSQPGQTSPMNMVMSSSNHCANSFDVRKCADVMSGVISKRKACTAWLACRPSLSLLQTALSCSASLRSGAATKRTNRRAVPEPPAQTHRPERRRNSTLRPTRRTCSSEATHLPASRDRTRLWTTARATPTSRAASIG